MQLLFAGAALTLSGCVASSNFYSGRTLEENSFSFGFGADDIVLAASDPGLTISKERPFVPSFLASYGLPWRMEIGARYTPIRYGELTLRHQVNPRSFDAFDLSLNLHYAALFGAYSYLRHGLTVSKNISEFEPYAHYTAYHYVGGASSVFEDSFLSGVSATLINNNRAIGLGIALPLRQAKLYPEVNYQYFGGDLSHGLWHFGVGIRIYPGYKSAPH